jgi:hypothetical protein
MDRRRLNGSTKSPADVSSGTRRENEQGAGGAAAARIHSGRGPEAEPRIERIARRAHELYDARGGTHGRALEDWLQAEREIDAEP